MLIWTVFGVVVAVVLNGSEGISTGSINTQAHLLQMLRVDNGEEGGGGLRVKHGEVRPGESPIYYIHLPPSHNYYSLHTVSSAELPHTKVDVEFIINGRPEKVYHWTPLQSRPHPALSSFSPSHSSSASTSPPLTTSSPFVSSSISSSVTASTSSYLPESFSSSSSPFSSSTSSSSSPPSHITTLYLPTHHSSPPSSPSVYHPSTQIFFPSPSTSQRPPVGSGQAYLPHYPPQKPHSPLQPEQDPKLPPPPLSQPLKPQLPPPPPPPPQLLKPQLPYLPQPKPSKWIFLNKKYAFNGRPSKIYLLKNENPKKVYFSPRKARVPISFRTPSIQ